MKTRYKGCDIEVTREKSLDGSKELYFSIFDNGFEVSSGFSCGNDTIKDYIKYMKETVDDYRENPQNYTD